MNRTSLYPGAIGKQMRRVNDRLDVLLYLLGVYAVPIGIALISVLAVFFFEPLYGIEGGTQVDIQIALDATERSDPSQARGLLANEPYRQFLDTRLSEKPVWLSFSVQGGSKTDSSLEFPSRHAVDLTCWDAASLRLLGRGTRDRATGAVTPSKAGFALALGTVSAPQQFLCRTSSVGPARVVARLWSTEALEASTHLFHHNAGMLNGGILILAFFVLITAIVNRVGMYVLFAGWLVVNLRMASLSAGWDNEWLGVAIPYEWLIPLRLITLSMFYAITAVLFTTLMREDLRKIGYWWVVRAYQWSCLPVIVLSLTLPFKQFLPFIWAATAIAIPTLIFLLAQILRKTRSPVAMWYSASIAVTLFASLSEVIAAATGIKGVVGSINSVTAALSSSLLAALAIAEQMRQKHHQWLEAKAQLQHTYDVMPIGLFTLDLRGRFRSFNPALCAMLGIDTPSRTRVRWGDFFNPDSWALLETSLREQTEVEIEISRNAVPDQVRTTRFLVKATLAGDKIEGSLQDVTVKSLAMAELQFLANNDPLTKVLNRRGIERAMQEALFQAVAGQPLAIAYLDLDRFKLINDLYGHVAGDDVLQQVCQRITHMLSGEMRVGRVGGDEFLLVLPATKIAMATAICRGIAENLMSQPYQVGEKAFQVRVSIGLIEVGETMKVKDVISTADRACRDAKAGQGEGLVVYERHAAALQKHEAELKLVARLATSNATDGLYIVMQPIMSLTAPHESLNFEVLLRMRDELGANVPTDRIIAAAENSGRMSMIDLWVLTTTLDWLNLNFHQIKHTKFVCLNLSGASLNDEKFLQKVYDLLELNGHIAKQICLEITESVALHDLSNTRRFVDRVRSYGTKVALDDFGAGYTSFSYLKDLTADLLKIDGSFIVNMNRHPANIAIVEAIVSLAKNLGMKTIAEWAEDNATVHTLTEIGVDYVQGYAVSHPQSPAKLLTADSSASFIQDEELAMYAYMIGKSSDVMAQPDLFTEPVAKGMH